MTFSDLQSYWLLVNTVSEWLQWFRAIEHTSVASGTIHPHPFFSPLLLAASPSAAALLAAAAPAAAAARGGQEIGLPLPRGSSTCLRFPACCPATYAAACRMGSAKPAECRCGRGAGCGSNSVRLRRENPMLNRVCCLAAVWGSGPRNCCMATFAAQKIQ